MTFRPQGNIAVELGERLMELGVTESVCAYPDRLELVRAGKAVLVVRDMPMPYHSESGTPIRQWGVCPPDIAYALFLKEVLP